ncbi:PrsW family intramembrane metalloprotease [Lignipirellula cremea]|uniref:Protease PrsW n=1 Tax=Lignipirellula cremea TaxID=2528010 RepID=A0A518DLN8_9BACT|nr:PrsW family intramembrane metalloprotease [Lignipirellula cremea]QDU92747.1 hypothetical protein Pla8534_04960 [Lignipirellula cremea]
MALFEIALVTGLLPMLVYAAALWWLDHWEREPLKLVAAVFLWGAVPAVLTAIISSTLLERALSVSVIHNPATMVAATYWLVAPLTEELSKGAALLFLYLWFRREIDSLFDGVLYGAAIGFGFAAVENVLYFIGFGGSGTLELTLLIFLRSVAFGLNHAFFTSLTGLGFAFARFQRRPVWKVAAPLIGLALAMFFHGLHNYLVISGLPGLVLSFLVTWFGIFWVFVLLMMSLRHQGQLLQKHLEQEVELDVITAAQARTACSLRHRLFLGLLAGRPSAEFSRNDRRLDQLCAKLALKKHQLAKAGNLSGEFHEILTLRQEVAALSRDHRLRTDTA